MELSDMFTEQKWNIIKCLSQENLSPLQLSQKLDSTMANISHQLKLLEAAHLVQKRKIRNRDKGKPRSLFSLSDDHVYLVPAMHDFAAKKLLKANDHHKMMLRIWFLENRQLHYPLEKLYWSLEKSFDSVQAIFVDQQKGKIMVVSDNKDLEGSFEGIDAAIALIPTKQKPSASSSVTVIYERSNPAA